MDMVPPKPLNVGLDRAVVDRKLSAPKGEIEKAASGKRQSFMKAPHEKPAMQYDADVLLEALCKPWEMGGHTHDFYLSHRSTRCDDPYTHYETDKFSIRKHETMVAEKVAWNRQRQLREDMLHLLTRLHSIERQRRRFIEKRREKHPEDYENIPGDFKEENENIKLGAIANTFFQKRPSQLELMRPFKPPPEYPENPVVPPPPTTSSNLIEQPKYVLEPVSPRTVKLRQEVEGLDVFDDKLQSLLPPAQGSTKSFPKKKKK